MLRRTFVLGTLLAGLLVISVSAPSAYADDTFPSPSDPQVIATPDIATDPTIGVDVSLMGNDAFSLADSSYTLDQVDLSTGQLLGPDLATELSNETSTDVALLGAGALAFDPSSLESSAQAQQSQAEAAAQAQLAARYAGCPTSAPAGTLRGGADIETLCKHSVDEARSSAAARAIKAALNNLGVPYSQPLRNSPGYFDCSSFVTRMYTISGTPLINGSTNAPTTFTIYNAPWARREPISQARPGDLVEPWPDHVVMLLADGYVVQASQPGDVTNVTPVYWSTPYAALWIDPSRL